MVPGEVFDVVLPLAVRVVSGFPNNLRAASLGLLAVTVNVFNPHHHRGSQPGLRTLFDQNDRAIAGIQLGAMISHLDPHGKSERPA